MQSKSLREFLKAGGFSKSKVKNGIKNDKYNHSDRIPKKGVNNTGAVALQKRLPSDKVYYLINHPITDYGFSNSRTQENYSGRNIEYFIIV